MAQAKDEDPLWGPELRSKHAAYDLVRSARAHKRTARTARVLLQSPPKAQAQPPAKRPRWWFWDKQEPVASCGTSAAPVPHAAEGFPLRVMEQRGFSFAHGEEWNVLTRELCEYVADPG